jgi:hypothetical protein
MTVKTMRKHCKVLIVVADGEHVRFVRPAADNSLQGDAELDSISAHKRSEELGSDHSGASFHRGTTCTCWKRRSSRT